MADSTSRPADEDHWEWEGVQVWVGRGSPKEAASLSLFCDLSPVLVSGLGAVKCHNSVSKPALGSDYWKKKDKKDKC